MKPFKTTKTMKKNYLLKAFGVVAIMALLTTQANAQTTPGVAVNVTKGPNTVKVIDNKGTIKYFQSNNGITQITNTTADKTTTTWQLGGTLTENTYINAEGKAFGLKGLDLTAVAAATDTVSSATGYTLLVSNGATGEVERLLATSLITAGVGEFVLAADIVAATPYTTVAITGLPTVANRISVFRNGIKLRQTSTTPDWTLGTTTDAGKIKFTADAGDFYTADVIEVQWVN
jgi:hypothetical protein